MNNVITFHPPKSALSLFYEVVGEDGESRWGGESPVEAISWYKAGVKLMKRGRE